MTGERERLIASVIDVFQNNEENMQDTIWSLVHEALERYSVYELKEFLA